MGVQGEEYKAFNYSDIIFSYFFSDECKCTKMVRDHFLVYVYSGEYVLEESSADERVVVRPGECVFVRRDNRVNMYKQPIGGEPFQGIFMNFKRSFLRDVFQKFPRKELPQDVHKFERSVIELPGTPDLKGLFLSMTPYFDSSVKPAEDIMRLKLLEGIHSLLHIDERFFPTLFDFAGQWKVDILDFLNANYMYDLSIEEIASFTGRSLSTFKRDFRKVSSLSPEKWLIRRRLEAARNELQRDGRSITEVCMDVGFKNFSHFSASFKREFGVAPSNYVPQI